MCLIKKMMFIVKSSMWTPFMGLIFKISDHFFLHHSTTSHRKPQSYDLISFEHEMMNIFPSSKKFVKSFQFNFPAASELQSCNGWGCISGSDLKETIFVIEIFPLQFRLPKRKGKASGKNCWRKLIFIVFFLLSHSHPVSVAIIFHRETFLGFSRDFP